MGSEDEEGNFISDSIGPDTEIYERYGLTLFQAYTKWPLYFNVYDLFMRIYSMLPRAQDFDDLHSYLITRGVRPEKRLPKVLDQYVETYSKVDISPPTLARLLMKTLSLII